MLVHDGVEAGIVVPLKDGKPDQDRLNEVMLKMAKNKDVIKKYEEGAKKLTCRFDMDKCIDAYRKLIDR